MNTERQRKESNQLETLGPKKLHKSKFSFSLLFAFYVLDFKLEKPENWKRQWVETEKVPEGGCSL